MTTELANDVIGAPPVGISAWLGRIVCGDNTEVLSGFPAESVDLVVTSPPYDDLRTYGGHSWNFETLAAQLVRVLKPGGVIVWVVADATGNEREETVVAKTSATGGTGTMTHTQRQERAKRLCGSVVRVRQETHQASLSDRARVCVCQRVKGEHRGAPI